MSAYKVAIEQTTRAIDKRATYYRNLIVAVVFISLISAVWAVFAWAIAPLAGFFLLLPVCGFYFFLDGKLLNDWRSQLFASWVRKDMDFCALCHAVGAIPALPQNTLQSMLVTLPAPEDVASEQGLSSSTRDAIAAVVTAIHACRSDAIALKMAGYAIVGGSLLSAVTLWAWQPLLGTIAAVALPWLRKPVQRWRLRRLRERTLSAQRQLDFDHKQCVEFVAWLPWEPISEMYTEFFANASA